MAYASKDKAPLPSNNLNWSLCYWCLNIDCEWCQSVLMTGNSWRIWIQLTLDWRWDLRLSLSDLLSSCHHLIIWKIIHTSKRGWRGRLLFARVFWIYTAGWKFLWSPIICIILSVIQSIQSSISWKMVIFNTSTAIIRVLMRFSVFSVFRS